MSAFTTMVMRVYRSAMIDKRDCEGEVVEMGTLSERCGDGRRGEGGPSRGREGPVVEMVTSFVVHCAVLAILVSAGTVASLKGEGRRAITVSLHAGARALQEHLSTAVNTEPSPPSHEPTSEEREDSVIKSSAVSDIPEVQLAELVHREISAVNPLLGPGGGVRLPDSDAGVADAANGPVGPVAATGEGKTPRIHETDFGRPDGPRFLKRVDPIYPLIARRLGKEGRVVLSLTIDARGELLAVEILEKADYGFDRSAVEAVRASSFLPAVKGGATVASRSTLVVKFVIDE